MNTELQAMIDAGRKLIAEQATAAKRLQPPDRAGHRRIDKAITALEAELGVNDTIYELRKRNP